MSAEPNFIKIVPAELSFKFELRKNIPVTMQLTNPTDDRVAFKVKTTSPKKYCVRPSRGIIEANSTKEVQVILQSQREPPVSYAECRDKFLVQCIKVDSSVKEATSELFEASKAREIRQTKLRVVLVPPAKPPSPVPEGNESEPTSPPFSVVKPDWEAYCNEAFAFQELTDSNLRSLTIQQTAPPSQTAAIEESEQVSQEAELEPRILQKALNSVSPETNTQFYEVEEERTDEKPSVSRPPSGHILGGSRSDSLRTARLLKFGYDAHEVENDEAVSQEEQPEELAPPGPSEIVGALMEGGGMSNERAVAAEAELLEECGVASLEELRTALQDPQSRAAVKLYDAVEEVLKLKPMKLVQLIDFLAR